MRLNKIISIVMVILMLLSITVLFGCAPSDVDVSMDLKVGQTIGMTSDSVFAFSLLFEEEEIDTNFSMITGMTIQVKEVDENGNYIMEATYDTLSFVLESNEFDGVNIEYEYDSTNVDKQDQYTEVIDLLIGDTFTVKISADRKLISLERLDEIEKEIFDAMDKMDENDLIMMFGIYNTVLDQLLEYESIKESIENYTWVDTQGPVKVGDSWTEWYKLEGEEPWDIENVYTLLEIKRRTAVVELITTIHNSENNMIEEGVIYNVSGEAKGTMEIDIATGLIVKTDIEINADAEIIIEGNEFFPGMSLPMTIVSESFVEAKIK